MPLCGNPISVPISPQLSVASCYKFALVLENSPCGPGYLNLCGIGERVDADLPSCAGHHRLGSRPAMFHQWRDFAGPGKLAACRNWLKA